MNEAAKRDKIAAMQVFGEKGMYLLTKEQPQYLFKRLRPPWFKC